MEKNLWPDLSTTLYLPPGWSIRRTTVQPGRWPWQWTLEHGACLHVAGITKHRDGLYETEGDDESVPYIDLPDRLDYIIGEHLRVSCEQEEE